MMNKVEMNEEMMETVVGGINNKYNVGDHVEVKGWFGGTCGATVTEVIETNRNSAVYHVKYDHWYDEGLKDTSYLYHENEFEN